MFGLTPLGAIHTAISLIALGAGLFALLRDGRISVVLHNDLRADARLAMRLILQQQGALPVEPARPVPIQVITPYNLPP